jgi:uncharacterized protein YkwD
MEIVMYKFVRYLIFFSIFVLFFLNSCDDENSVDPIINQEFNEFVLQEVNFARTDPQGYAEQRLNESFQTSNDNGAYLDLKSRNGVHPLELNDELNNAASKYAKYLADNNRFGHFENGSPDDRAEAEGYNRGIGENIAANSSFSYNAENDPQLSAINFVRFLIIDNAVPDLGHRVNILKEDYISLGVGFSRNENADYVNYFVQNFGDI